MTDDWDYWSKSQHWRKYIPVPQTPGLDPWKAGSELTRSTEAWSVNRRTTSTWSCQLQYKYNTTIADTRILLHGHIGGIRSRDGRRKTELNIVKEDWCITTLAAWCGNTCFEQDPLENSTSDSWNWSRPESESADWLRQTTQPCRPWLIRWSSDPAEFENFGIF